MRFKLPWGGDEEDEDEEPHGETINPEVAAMLRKEKHDRPPAGSSFWEHWSDYSS